MRAKLIWRIIGVVAFALFLASCHQNGTVFAVDTSDDTVDVTPGDGLCADASGDCSLRAAVMEANELPGVEEIRLVDGEIYRLTIEPDGPDDAASGDLDITAGVVITGDGLIIGRPQYGTTEMMDVFHVDGASGFVEIDGPDFQEVGTALRVTDASASLVNSNLDSFRTSAVVLEGGQLWVWSSSFRNNLFLEVPAVRGVSGRLHLQNVTIADMYASHGVLQSEDADVTVLSSTFGRNSGPFAGLSADPAGSGSITIQRSVLETRGLNPISCLGDVTSLGHNVTGDDSCAFGSIGDQVMEYPVAGTLNQTSGEVSVFVLSPTSPLVNVAGPGPCTLSGLDARGGIRPTGGACDPGAFEVDTGDCHLPGPGADLHNCNFTNADLAGMDLRDADFTGAWMRDADLSSADLRGANFTGARLTFTEFANADLTDAILLKADGPMRLDGANLTRADLRGAEALTAEGANFTDVNAANFHVWQSGPVKSFANAIFEGADFSGYVGNFWEVSSGGIVGEPTALPDEMILERGYLFGRGVIVSGADLSNLDLSAANFAGGTGIGTDFSGSTIRGLYSFALMNEAVFDGADLATTYMYGADLERASFLGSDLSDIDATYTDWNEATIIGSDFSGSNLGGADFTDAVMLLNTFGNTVCPSGVNSDDNSGNCDGQFDDGEPLPLGAEVPPELTETIAAIAADGI